MHMLAALDLATGKILYRIRSRKRHGEFLELLKALRTRWPGEKLYLVMDNFSPHRHPDVHAWAAANDVELVFLPTYSSWLNWIEAKFNTLRYFTLTGTDHHSHAEQNAAIATYCTESVHLPTRQSPDLRGHCQEEGNRTLSIQYIR
ncbi:DDE superfamily endonuclease [Lentzea jiangxiensis]|uniref:DDE superfamily endonuclease n=1 Tax=Lentzea jiangxiensis TaxID=641025 RepID=A0A1H0RCC8_9PSEU|nr:DDE superfamily endonuclease [Lentzea jiangxiensis]